MSWDVIIIGSGFGGAMAAYAPVVAGQRVLMLERGSWVSRGPDNWTDRGVGLASVHYSMDAACDVRGERRYTAGAWNCVGGQSVFYGGASFRFRESDFAGHSRVLEGSGAEWPFGYDDLEPYYAIVERMLGVAGETGVDPTEPRRSSEYAGQPSPLSAPSRVIHDAARRLGLTPSRIPMAISYTGKAGRHACIRCGTCDGYACAAAAKNDLATGIIPSLIRRGMVLRENTICVRLLREGSRIVGVECVDRVTGERGRLRASNVILAAGVLATPHLVLASKLAEVSPASSTVGRYLTRHYNTCVFGVFRRRPNPDHVFDKQIAILDFYDRGGSIQQLTPPLGLVRAYLPALLRRAGAHLVSHSSGLMAIAEDCPRETNGVDIDTRRRDRYGLPRLRVHHRYSGQDRKASAFLVNQAKRVLREAGALFCWTHRVDTFTHGLGTMRMGVDARTSPLDGAGRYRGIDNLYVVDGSALPRAAAVNPSLTIAANALRIGFGLAQLVPLRELRSRSPRTITAPFFAGGVSASRRTPR
jgi:choline dehydrogenase-like flavoprotein